MPMSFYAAFTSIQAMMILVPLVSSDGKSSSKIYCVIGAKEKEKSTLNGQTLDVFFVEPYVDTSESKHS